MFGRVHNPLLVAVYQDILQQNKCAGLIQKKLSHILGYFVNTVIYSGFVQMKSRRMSFKSRKWTTKKRLAH